MNTQQTEDIIQSNTSSLSNNSTATSNQDQKNSKTQKQQYLLVCKRIKNQCTIEYIQDNYPNEDNQFFSIDEENGSQNQDQNVTNLSRNISNEQNTQYNQNQNNNNNQQIVTNEIISSPYYMNKQPNSSKKMNIKGDIYDKESIVNYIKDYIDDFQTHSYESDQNNINLEKEIREISKYYLKCIIQQIARKITSEKNNKQINGITLPQIISQNFNDDNNLIQDIFIQVYTETQLKDVSLIELKRLFNGERINIESTNIKQQTSFVFQQYFLIYLGSDDLYKYLSNYRDTILEENIFEEDVLEENIFKENIFEENILEENKITKKRKHIERSEGEVNIGIRIVYCLIGQLLKILKPILKTNHKEQYKQTKRFIKEKITQKQQYYTKTKKQQILYELQILKKKLNNLSERIIETLNIKI